MEPSVSESKCHILIFQTPAIQVFVRVPLSAPEPGVYGMPHLYVATNGLSVWRSEDLGATLLRMSTVSQRKSGGAQR